MNRNYLNKIFQNNKKTKGTQEEGESNPVIIKTNNNIKGKMVNIPTKTSYPVTISSYSSKETSSGFNNNISTSYNNPSILAQSVHPAKLEVNPYSVNSRIKNNTGTNFMKNHKTLTQSSNNSSTNMMIKEITDSPYSIEDYNDNNTSNKTLSPIYSTTSSKMRKSTSISDFQRKSNLISKNFNNSSTDLFNKGGVLSPTPNKNEKKELNKLNITDSNIQSYKFKEIEDDIDNQSTYSNNSNTSQYSKSTNTNIHTTPKSTSNSQIITNNSLANYLINLESLIILEDKLFNILEVYKLLNCRIYETRSLPLELVMSGGVSTSSVL